VRRRVGRRLVWRQWRGVRPMLIRGTLVHRGAAFRAGLTAGFGAPAAARAVRTFAAPLLLALAVLTSASPVAAQRAPHRFEEQPAYALELEPHLVAGIADPPGPGTAQGAGVGLRGSFVVSRDGFINNVNDSIAIGFGIDALHYRGQNGSLYGTCVRRQPGPGGTSVCTEVDVPGGPRNYLFIPMVMQWNFWLHPQWSAFVEPGLAVFLTNRGAGAAPSLSVGGRMQISDAVSLVFRLGWPTTTLGVSVRM
jgi:hypothetical protein